MQAGTAVSRLVHLDQHAEAVTVAAAIAAFLAEHQLSSGSQRVYSAALRTFQDHLGANTMLAVLNEPSSTKRFDGWFYRRYGQSAPAARSTSTRLLAKQFGVSQGAIAKVVAGKTHAHLV